MLDGRGTILHGRRVILDDDLAELYGVTTKRLNEQVNRNKERFPEDFALRLTKAELTHLRSQIATSSWGGRRYLPRAFTEHGAVMLASVLRTPVAIEASIQVVRAFVRLREIVAANRELAQQLELLERRLVEHDREFEVVFDAIRKLMQPLPDPDKPPIGFETGEQEYATAIITNMPNPPSIDHDGGDRAFYRPSADSIHMPAVDSFEGAEEYHSTLFHELSHSTGHESRLNRHGMETGIAAFGSAVYSKEELAAEFGSAFLGAHAGIQGTLDNGAAYIAGRSRALRADNRMVITAASQGQRAADYIIGE